MNPRTCIVTREELCPSRMIRFVSGPDDQVVPDLKRKLPGRGVWVTIGKTNLETAISRGLFSRGFKKKVQVAADLPQMLEKLLRNECKNLLSLAKKAGLLVSGFSKVETMIRSGDASVILHASQAASDGKGKLAQAIRVTELDEIPVFELFCGEELDEALGADNITHIGLLSGKLTNKFIESAKRLDAYLKH